MSILSSLLTGAFGKLISPVVFHRNKLSLQAAAAVDAYLELGSEH